MNDPTMGEADLLFEQAEAEAAAKHHATAAALFGQAAEAYSACRNPGLAALAMHHRGWQLFAAGEPAAAADAYAQACSLARGQEDLRLFLGSSCGRADSLAALGDWDAVLRICAEAVPLMREYSYEDYLGELLMIRARAESAVDRPVEESLATVQEAHAVFRAAGAVRQQMMAGDFAVDLLVNLDRRDEAIDLARRNVDLARIVGEEANLAYHHRRLGWACYLGGRAEQALAQFERARDGYAESGRAGPAGECMVLCARVLLDLDRDADAIETLGAAATVLEAAGPRWVAELDDARERLATAHYNADRFDAAITVDRVLLARYLDGTKLMDFDGQIVLERLTGSLVHRGRAAEAKQLIGELVALGATSDASANMRFMVRGCAAWADWHCEEREAAVEAAADILPTVDLWLGADVEAWLLEILGSAAEPDDLVGLAQLARAQSIYALMGEATRLEHVSTIVLERTGGH